MSKSGDKARAYLRKNEKHLKGWRAQDMEALRLWIFTAFRAGYASGRRAAKSGGAGE